MRALKNFLGNLSSIRGTLWVAALASLYFVAPAKADTKLILQLATATPVMSYANLYVAEAAGFFKDGGIDVELRYVAGGPLAIQMVATDHADIAGVTLEALIVGYEKGLKGNKFIYDRIDQLNTYIAVPVDSDIKTIADLRGKSIGVINMGSTSLIVIRSMLRGAGVDPSSVTFVPTGGGPAGLAALDAARVQALGLIDAMYGAYEGAGRTFRYLHHPVLGQLGNGGYLVNVKTIETKRAALVSFIRAMTKSYLFINTNPEAAIKIYWKVNPSARGQGTEAEAVARSMKELKTQTVFFRDKPLDKVGQFGLDDVKKYIDVLKDEGAISATMPVSEIVDQSLVDEANAFDPTPIRKLARDWK